MKIYWLLLTIISVFSIEAQTVVFVAPDGNDLNIGDLSHPVKSIETALHIAGNQKIGKTLIYLREGEYRLTEPIILTEKDNYLEEKSLSIESFPDEKAIIKGSIQLITDWRPYRDGIIQTKIETCHEIDMLLVNGEIRNMARYPNYDAEAIRFNGTSADATSKSRVKSWRKPEGGYLHAMHVCDWGDFHYRILGKDSDNNLVLDGGWQNNRRIGLSEENRMVENIFEELDVPGEWYFDSETHMLFYFPLPDEDLESAIFEVPILKHLFELKGCRNITIRGLELTQTKRTFMENYEPLLRSDWTIYRGGAVLLENTENCAIDQCYLHNLGGNAVFFSNFNRNSVIKSSHITSVGASAVCFVGNPDAVRSPSFEYYESVPLETMDYTPGPKSDNYPRYCIAYDNLIHNIGIFEKQVTGVELSMCRNITVSHNSIYNTPRAGINVSEGTWGGHIIEYNDVFDTVKETGDHGSFNAWGRDRFWHPDRAIMDSIVNVFPQLILADVVDPIVIRNNRFRCDRGWDIDLDDGSSNYQIYNNLCLNGGIKLREGFYRKVDNNILVNNTFHPHVWFDRCSDIFTHNIVMRRYEPIHIDSWGKETDYNIFTDSVAYITALSNTTDLNSIVSDVKFENSEKGNFSVDICCPEIFRQGFQNFDMENFGVVSPELKSIASVPVFPDILYDSKEIDECQVYWKGWNLKNLSTLGEQSATGMDSIRGVYVLSNNDVNPSLMANDVILKVGDQDTNNLTDFFNAVASANSFVNVTVLRNQHPVSIELNIENK